MSSQQVVRLRTQTGQRQLSRSSPPAVAAWVGLFAPEPTREPSREGKHAVLGEQRDNIYGNALILKQLFHLIRRQQDPRSATHHQDDACTLHFLGERADTAYRMVSVELHPLDRYTRSCCFVLHELQKIVRLFDVFPQRASVWPLWKTDQRQDHQCGTETARKCECNGNGRHVDSMGEREQQTYHDHHHFQNAVSPQWRSGCQSLR